MDMVNSHQSVDVRTACLDPIDALGHLLFSSRFIFKKERRLDFSLIHEPILCMIEEQARRI